MSYATPLVYYVAPLNEQRHTPMNYVAPVMSNATPQVNYVAPLRELRHAPYELRRKSSPPYELRRTSKWATPHPL